MPSFGVNLELDLVSPHQDSVHLKPLHRLADDPQKVLVIWPDTALLQMHVDVLPFGELFVGMIEHLVVIAGST